MMDDREYPMKFKSIYFQLRAKDLERGVREALYRGDEGAGPGNNENVLASDGLL